MSEVQAAAKVRVVLTRAEKIAQYEEKAAALIAQANELRAEQAREDALQSVGAGFVVSFEAGRAETRRTVEGNVLAAYEIDGKRKVKVLAGEGADAELFEVEVSKLLSAVDPTPAAEEEGDELAGL